MTARTANRAMKKLASVKSYILWICNDHQANDLVQDLMLSTIGDTDHSTGSLNLETANDYAEKWRSIYYGIVRGR